MTSAVQEGLMSAGLTVCMAGSFAASGAAATQLLGEGATEGALFGGAFGGILGCALGISRVARRYFRQSESLSVQDAPQTHSRCTIFTMACASVLSVGGGLAAAYEITKAGGYPFSLPSASYTLFSIGLVHGCAFGVGMLLKSCNQTDEHPFIVLPERR